MISTDKAYIFGLIIGGGVFGDDPDSFYISLPYRNWGDVATNPTRVSQISQDILRVVKPVFQNEYGLSVAYDLGNNWKIICDGNLDNLKNDFLAYDITLAGEMRKNSSITKLVDDISSNKVIAKRFLAGLADTIGSTAPSHRRFNDDVQIVSFEISGFNYAFVCDLCRLLSTLECYPDQIIWNHPNIHSTSDPYYTSWKKGFKVRVTLDQYSNFGSFAFSSKTKSASDNLKKQSKTNVAQKCSDQEIVLHGTSCVHPAENSSELPETIKGGHFLHYKHFCAVLGCPFAPYEEIEKCIKCASEYILPFPVLSKYSLNEVRTFVSQDNFLSKRKFVAFDVFAKDIFDAYKNHQRFMYGNGTTNGYPLNEIMDAIGYILASEKGELNGKRIRGNRDELLERCLTEDPDKKITFELPDLLSVLVVHNGESAAMVGAQNPEVYKKLISRSKVNKYKLLVRELKEEDFDGAK